jgi:hypothetical protein
MAPVRVVILPGNGSGSVYNANWYGRHLVPCVLLMDGANMVCLSREFAKQ